MVNKNILLSRLTDKFNMLTFHSIVNEAFINGLPLNQNDISIAEKRQLTRYSYDVLNALGGFKVLESAFSDKNTDAQNMLLGDMYVICNEAARGAAKRCANETDCASDKCKLDEVVDKSAFTDKEYKNFATKADKMGLSEISDIVKEKTLNVIKDEKEQYEQETALDNELKDALADSKDFSDTSVESYVDMFIDKTAPRHHVSLFSKLQETAMEMSSLVESNEEGMNPLPLVYKVTFESFTDNFKDSSKYTEFMDRFNIANECDCQCACAGNKPQLATLVSVIVYTMLETMKTLNLYSPSVSDVKSFVDSKRVSGDIVNEDNSIILKRAAQKVQESNNIDFSKVDSNKLTSHLFDLKRSLESVQKISTSEADKIIVGLESSIEEITGIMAERLADSKKKPANESYYTSLKKENDVAQFNKVKNLYGNDARVKEIRLRVSPDQSMQSLVNVECANESGQIINRSFMNIEYACEGMNYMQYLKDAYDKSTLAGCDKPVSLIVNDGRGKKISLK